jgi:hypothetical protein
MLPTYESLLLEKGGELTRVNGIPCVSRVDLLYTLQRHNCLVVHLKFLGRTGKWSKDDMLNTDVGIIKSIFF